MINNGSQFLLFGVRKYKNDSCHRVQRVNWMPGDRLGPGCTAQGLTVYFMWDSLIWGNSFQNIILFNKDLLLCATRQRKENSCVFWIMEWNYLFNYVFYLLSASYVPGTTPSALHKSSYLLIKKIIVTIFNENWKKKIAHNHTNKWAKHFYLLTVMFNGSKLSESMYIWWLASALRFSFRTKITLHRLVPIKVCYFCLQWLKCQAD